LAELRLQHPEASLQELGELLEPPLGKSGVNHRMRKLEKMAMQLTKGSKEHI
jgi:cell division protein WhiA